MKMRLGCLHAHHSNIEYIENAIAPNDLQLVHFVDPGLMSRISSDKNFELGQAQNKVIEQVEWIAQANVDAILITCTNYITLLDEERLKTSIPIIKIDEPFFAHICTITEQQVLLFTNPATVEGTMKRLNEYANRHQKTLNQIEVCVIEGAFEWIMKGEKEHYENDISDSIRSILLSDGHKVISVVQLSMVEAAVNMEREMNAQIGNPLKTLVSLLNQEK